MKYVQICRAGLSGLGVWFVEDPRRLTVTIAAITVLATAALALTIGLPQPGVLVGPNSSGGGGG
jgi:hypothetical protein